MKNTNNYWKLSTVAALCGLVFLFTSCDLFKSVPKEETVYDEVPGEIKGGKIYNPETGQEEEVDYIPTNMDTINWRRNPSSDAPPIQTNGQNNGGNSGNNPNTGDNTNPNNTGEGSANNGGQINTPNGIPTTMKSSYDVAMMLPFVTNKFSAFDSKIYAKSEWAIQYYGGAQLAIDQLKGEGINLNINVLDTQGSEGKVITEISNNPAIQNADLIIGPYRSVNVRKVAQYAKDKQIPVISPYSAASNVSDDNPFLVQVNPSLSTHIEKITAHALSKFNADQIVLVVRDKAEEKARLAIFQNAHKAIKKSDDVSPFREFVIEDDGKYDNLDAAIRNYIVKGSTTVFIVPTWSNEIFVNSFLRQVEIARRSYDNVTIYGMPQWMEYANTDYTYFEKLDVHVSTSFFINKSTEDARTFRQSFYSRYGKRADKAAYLGYDVMLYFGRQIHNGGTQFQQFLSENTSDMLHANFMFEPIFDASPGTDASAPIERYENRSVHLLEFENYQWQKAN
ncbi:MAG: hypothetical protein ACI85O_001617 [Saprospiraceae bacterium]|jgi:hypothetical protein